MLTLTCRAFVSHLAAAEKYQLEIVKSEGLPPLLRLLHSTYLPLILSSAACVRNVSIHPSNESPIIDSGFLQPLIDLLSFEENEEVQCHAISTLRNLAASSEKNKGEIVNAGAVERIRDLVLSVPVGVQSEMTACVAVLALSGAYRSILATRLAELTQPLAKLASPDDLKPQLLELGICEVLIPLTNSPSVEVQGNSAAAIGNLSSKAADDYNAFNKVWNRPEGGLHTYLVRFLGSSDMTFQHIAVWTLVQLLESEGTSASAGSPLKPSNLTLLPLTCFPPPQTSSFTRTSSRRPFYSLLSVSSRRPGLARGHRHRRRTAPARMARRQRVARARMAQTRSRV